MKIKISVVYVLHLCIVSLRFGKMWEKLQTTVGELPQAWSEKGELQQRGRRSYHPTSRQTWKQVRKNNP